MVSAVFDVMDQEDRRSRSIDDILDNARNVAAILSDEELRAVGAQVVEDFGLDLESQGPWLQMMQRALELASQETSRKSTPWDGAANIKHSLILEACIQFASRALPEIVRDRTVAKTNVYGSDPTGEKAQRAERCGQFMNFQILERMEDWEENLDRMLMILSMVGTTFKKVYYCPVRQLEVSEICLPDRVICNQMTKSLQSARRVTHIVDLYDSQIEERVRLGVFSEVGALDDLALGGQPENDQVRVLLEQHRYLDLDHDGYPEPYVVTVHEQTRKVLRITPRFASEDIKQSDEIFAINATHHFADFHFIRSIDGSFYSYGFGYLLSHASETINSLLNQLVDAGTLSNMQSGFIGKGARIEADSSGRVVFEPGEWKQANASGADLANNIYPLPTREPSGTLFSLLQFLLQSYYRMVSISDIMSGQISGSNTTAAEALAAVEQGTKVMNAIYKRVYIGLRKEFRLIFALNQRYLHEIVYNTYFDGTTQFDPRKDFDSTQFDVTPIADASMTSQMEELLKLRALVEMLDRIPEINRIELGRRLLKAMRVEDIDALLPPQDPNAPTPQQMQIQEALQQQADQLNALERQLQIKEAEVQIKAEKAQYEVMKLAADAALAVQKARAEGASAEIDAAMVGIKDMEARAKLIQALTVEPANGEKDESTRKRSKSGDDSEVED
jgi:chaperonin GroES